MNQRVEPLLPVIHDLLKPSGDVDRMIAQALEVAGHECHLNGNGHGDFGGGQLSGEVHVQVIDLVVSHAK